MADSWTIAPQGQRQAIELNPGGTGFQTVWEVTYLITAGAAQGQTGSVRIPEPLYSPETVRATVQAAVDRATAIAAL